MDGEGVDCGTSPSDDSGGGNARVLLCHPVSKTAATGLQSWLHTASLENSLLKGKLCWLTKPQLYIEYL